jgi:hypothetical protein
MVAIEIVSCAHAPSTSHAMTTTASPTRRYTIAPYLHLMKHRLGRHYRSKICANSRNLQWKSDNRILARADDYAEPHDRNFASGSGARTRWPPCWDGRELALFCQNDSKRSRYNTHTKRIIEESDGQAFRSLRALRRRGIAQSYAWSSAIVSDELDDGRFQVAPDDFELADLTAKRMNRSTLPKTSAGILWPDREPDSRPICRRADEFDAG